MYSLNAEVAAAAEVAASLKVAVAAAVAASPKVAVAKGQAKVAVASLKVGGKAVIREAAAALAAVKAGRDRVEVGRPAAFRA